MAALYQAYKISSQRLESQANKSTFSDKSCFKKHIRRPSTHVLVEMSIQISAQSSTLPSLTDAIQIWTSSIPLKSTATATYSASPSLSSLKFLLPLSSMNIWSVFTGSNTKARLTRTDGPVSLQRNPDFWIPAGARALTIKISRSGTRLKPLRHLLSPVLQLASNHMSVQIVHL